MPEILDRCVAHVMDKGHDENSAYAICRTSLGLKDDGTEDDRAPEWPEEDMKIRAEFEMKRRQFQNAPAVRKKSVVCTPFGEYVNGEYEGVMTASRLKRIAANFTKHGRQVPIYAMGDHVDDLDERIPDGWVEGLEVNDRGELVADMKLIGNAAQLVLEDRLRGASIGTVQGRNPDGSSQGEVLQHLLLTNNPFDKSLNIAAARPRSAEPIAAFFTALPPVGVNDMAEDKNVDQKPDEKDASVQLKEKDDEIVRLRAEVLELKDKLDNATVDEEKHELALRVAKLERKTLAQEVRELCFKMLKQGTIKPSRVEGYAKGGDDGTLAWFKASIFKGDLATLKWAAEHNEPIYKLGQTFKAGLPSDNEVALTADDRALIRKLGMDPDKVVAGMKSGTREEFNDLTTNKEN